MDGERFAKLLLQSTQLNDKDIKEYIERLKSRQATKIVSFSLFLLYYVSHPHDHQVRWLCFPMLFINKYNTTIWGYLII